jgi:hypothetical protein
MIILHKTKKEHEHQNHLEEQRNLWITRRNWKDSKVKLTRKKKGFETQFNQNKAIEQI